MILDALGLALLVKVVATMALVVGVTIAAERGGPFWGGLLCALPLGAGPGYVLLALERDSGFIADAALSSVAANVAVAGFLATIVWLAPRVAAIPTLLGAGLCWLAAVLAIREVAWTTSTASAATIATIAVCCWLTRGFANDVLPPAGRRSWFDLPLRALMVGVAVAAIVTASELIGPSLTGIALVFPFVLGGLTVVLHARRGGRAAAATMATALRALPGFAAALLIVHLLAPVHVWLSLVAGLGGSIAWASGMMVWRIYTRPAFSTVG